MRPNLSLDRLLAALAVTTLLMTGEVASAQQGLGPEFPVNTLAPSSGFQPPEADVATGPGGEFMVVWQSLNSAGSDSDGTSVQAQRFDAAGGMSGSQFQVNTATTGNQSRAGVAIDGSGAAIVVWSNDFDISGQRFDASGNPVGSEFAVADTYELEFEPVIAVTPGGVSIAAWGASEPPLHFDHQIRARRYDAAGSPLGGVFVVSSAGGGPFQSVQRPSVSMAFDGSAVVAWDYHSLDLNFVQAQRYDSAGNPVGGVIEVSGSFEGDASVAHDGTGGFVLSWDSQTFYPDTTALRLRRYNASGNPVGPLFTLASGTDRHQGPDVAVGPSGVIMVVWSHVAPGPLGPSPYRERILGQRLTPAGALSGGNFVVTPFSTPRSYYAGTRPALSFDEDNHFVVVWANDEDPAEATYEFAIKGRRSGTPRLPALGSPGLIVLAIATLLAGVGGLQRLQRKWR